MSTASSNRIPIDGMNKAKVVLEKRSDGNFKVVDTANLPMLMTDVEGAPSEGTNLERRKTNARLFTKKVFRVLKGLKRNAKIDLKKFMFDIQNPRGDSLREALVRTLDEDGINDFLRQLPRAKNSVASGYFLVVKPTKKRRRRLVEKRPIHRLYNQILD